MGKAIEKIALTRGHNIVLAIGSGNTAQLSDISPELVDVAIEFTRPELAAEHILCCIRKGVPVVCGTTAWQSKEKEVYDEVHAAGGALVHASNFSPGVNLFFLLNEYLASMMAKWKSYTPSITEIHHTAKLDAPSGTAITIANDILKSRPDLEGWAEGRPAGARELQITALRQDPAPGTHVVSYKSDIDDIVIIHEAHNREGFANGALMAAEWIFGKKGVFSMKDVLGLNR